MLQGSDFLYIITDLKFRKCCRMNKTIDVPLLTCYPIHALGGGLDTPQRKQKNKKQEELQC